MRPDCAEWSLPIYCHKHQVSKTSNGILRAVGPTASAQEAEPSSSPSAVGLAIYVALWLVIVMILSRDFFILNGYSSGHLFLHKLQQRHWLLSTGEKMTPYPGGPLSYRLGWWGFGIMCLTNLYVLRKRIAGMRNSGSISAWLDFHIFCGLLGPTLVVFHSNFHVSGLVAISFWSMIVAFFSGVIGRYFYTQLLEQRLHLQTAVAFYEDGFDRLLKNAGSRLPVNDLRRLKDEAFRLAGGSAAMVEGRATVFEVLIASILGDLRLLFAPPPAPAGIPKLRRPLKNYAQVRRRLAAAGYFRRLMGYWHAFHVPFSILMYGVSVFHIVAALIFRSNI